MPITPEKMYNGKLAVQLPPKLLPAFVFLSGAAITHPEVAGFPTFYLSAWAGNEAAIRKVLEIVFVAHWAGVRHAHTQDQHAISNAIIFLGNKLAESLERSALPTYEEEKPATAAPATEAQQPIQKPAPVKKAEKQPAKQSKPAPEFSRKPGTLATEK